VWVLCARMKPETGVSVVKAFVRRRRNDPCVSNGSGWGDDSMVAERPPSVLHQVWFCWLRLHRHPTSLGCSETANKKRAPPAQGASGGLGDAWGVTKPLRWFTVC
jgi:hypothetical protein